MMLEADPNAPYSTAARIYAEAGWTGVLPLPERKKNDPPKGYTGHDGAYPDEQQIDRWVQTNATGNIGLRLPEGMAGIDVDDYDGKTGGDTFRALKAAYGELPRTWISTSRSDGTSGIRLYRLPEPASLNDKPGPGIEIIQRHHRYIVAWPSIHPDTGDEYWWITPDGERSNRPPRPDEIPYLPDAWYQGLQAPKQRRVESLPFNGQAGVRWTQAVEAAYGRAMATMSGGRHDATLHGCAGLVRLRELGYPGADDALNRLEAEFLGAVGRDGSRSEKEAQAEWKRMLVGAEELVQSTSSIIRPYADLIAERRDEDDPIVTRRRSVRNKLPEAEPSQPTWDDEPAPIGTLRPDLPRFPIHVLPTWVGTMAAGVAEEMQLPVDMTATLALGAIATVAAGHVKVVVNPTWEEGVNLYLVVAMPPGAGKSPAAKKMLRPVQDYERELIEAAQPLVARYEQEQRIRDKAMKRAEDLGNKEEALNLLLEQESTKPVTVPQLLVDDATHSALVQMLNENHGRAAILSTEGALFDAMASPRYNESVADFQIYLKGFSGDWHKDRRVGRGATDIPEVTLTIALTVQPDVIAQLSAKPELAGRGLTARFMYAMPADMVGWRNFLNAPAVDPIVAERYRTRMLDLARHCGRHEMPQRLRLTPEAFHRFRQWHQDMEPRKRANGDLRAVAEWSEKLRSCVVRVAALLHLADGHDWDDIDVNTLERALEVADYWLEHARAVHALWSSTPASNVAQRVLDWLSENQMESFTARDSYKKGPLRNSDQAREVLPLLEEYGWVHLTEGGFGKGRSSAVFAVHPSVPHRATSGHMSATGDVAGMWPSGKRTHDGTFPQVTPGEDTEMDRSDVLWPSGISGPKYFSEDSLSDSERARISDPPATRATSPHHSTGQPETSPAERLNDPANDPADTTTERLLDPCPSCGDTHPADHCPAEL